MNSHKRLIIGIPILSGILIHFLCFQVLGADFTLLSSSITPVVQQAGTGQSRFTLVKPVISRLYGTTEPQSQTNRFTLIAKSQTVVVMNPPGLPKLKLLKGETDLDIEWSEDELLQVFTLEYADSISAESWNPAPVELTPTGRRHKVTSPARAGTRFYRLRKLP